MHATRAAVEEGIVAGGGVALVRAAKALDKFKANEDGEGDSDEQIGVNIVRRALEEPLRQIAANAGVEGAVVVERVRSAKGENESSTLRPLITKTSSRPSSVTRRITLLPPNAASIAGLILTYRCARSELPG